MRTPFTFRPRLRPFPTRRIVEVTAKRSASCLPSDDAARGAAEASVSDEGRLRNFVNVYLNDEDIRYLQKEQTPVKPGDSLSIVPSVAGGAPTATDVRPELSQDEIKRYSRHLIMPEVGIDGQRKLKASSVLCIGAGGLGSPAAMYLAAAGVGRIGIVDFDVVDFSNLQRQCCRRRPWGDPTGVRKDRLHALNPHFDTTPKSGTVSQNALDLFRRRRHFAGPTTSRAFTSSTTRATAPPNGRQHLPVRGQASFFGTMKALATSAVSDRRRRLGQAREAGAGVLPCIIGVIQATESIKLLTGVGNPLIGRFLIYDALKMKFRELKLRKDPECPVCGTNPTVTKLIDYEQFCGIRPEPQTSGATVSEWEITPVELKKKLDAGETPFILDVREPNEYQINRMPVDPDSTRYLPRRYRTSPEHYIVVHCKMVGRSAKRRLPETFGFKK